MLGTGRPQLIFWNQGAQALVLARVLENPRQADAWPLTVLHTGEAGSNVPYAEGLATADLDGDGDLDILNKPYTSQTPRVDVWLNECTERPQQ